MATDILILTIAQQINDLHEQAETAYIDGYRRALDYAMSAGRLLSQQKATMEHGEWKAWQEANLSFSVRRAQEYMQLAAAPQIEEARASAHLSIEDALRLVRKPRPAKRPTASDATALLQGLSALPQPSGERPTGRDRRRNDPREGVAAPSQPEIHRPSGTGNPPAPAPLAAPTSAWDERQERKLARVREVLLTIEEALQDAHQPRLSNYAVADVLRTAERDARQLVSALSDLAFSFERER